jgi:hypothetical protein
MAHTARSLFPRIKIPDYFSSLLHPTKTTAARSRSSTVSSYSATNNTTLFAFPTPTNPPPDSSSSPPVTTDEPSSSASSGDQAPGSKSLRSKSLSSPTLGSDFTTPFQPPFQPTMTPSTSTSIAPTTTGIVTPANTSDMFSSPIPSMSTANTSTIPTTSFTPTTTFTPPTTYGPNLNANVSATRPAANRQAGRILGGFFGVLGLVALVFFLAWLMRRNRKKRPEANAASDAFHRRLSRVSFNSLDMRPNSSSPFGASSLGIMRPPSQVQSDSTPTGSRRVSFAPSQPPSSRQSRMPGTPLSQTLIARQTPANRQSQMPAKGQFQVPAFLQPGRPAIRQYQSPSLRTLTPATRQHDRSMNQQSGTMTAPSQIWPAQTKPQSPSPLQTRPQTRTPPQPAPPSRAITAQPRMPSQFMPQAWAPSQLTPQSRALAQITPQSLAHARFSRPDSMAYAQVSPSASMISLPYIQGTPRQSINVPPQSPGLAHSHSRPQSATPSWQSQPWGLYSRPKSGPANGVRSSQIIPSNRRRQKTATNTTGSRPTSSTSAWLQEQASRMPSQGASSFISWTPSQSSSAWAVQVHEAVGHTTPSQPSRRPSWLPSQKSVVNSWVSSTQLEYNPYVGIAR